MPARQCYHCKEWIEEGSDHDCWTTTPEALTRELPEDIREAWERLREAAEEFGEQRVYASHHSIMFSRRACYFFVRPHSRRLDVCFFLGRPVRDPRIRSARPSSTVKIAHIVHVRHRDEVEAPLTDWLREAYEVSDTLSGRRAKPAAPARAASGRGPKRKPAGGPKKKAARRTSAKTKAPRRKKVDEGRQSPARQDRHGRSPWPTTYHRT